MAIAVAQLTAEADAFIEVIGRDLKLGVLPADCPAASLAALPYRAWLREGEFAALQRVTRAIGGLITASEESLAVVEVNESVGERDSLTLSSEYQALLAGYRGLYAPLAEGVRALAPSLGTARLSALLKVLDESAASSGDSRTQGAMIAASILAHAREEKASEVRLTPGRWRTLVEYRLGDQRRPIFELERSSGRALVIHFKLLTNTLDITKRDAPQEGVFRIDEPQLAGLGFHLLTSPVEHGEAAAIQIRGAR